MGIGQTMLNGLYAAGNFLDTPASMLRDTLAGENPFDQLATPFQDKNRTTGRKLLQHYGLVGENQDGLDWGDAAGFGVDMLLDPVNLLSGGLLGAAKAGKFSKGAKAAKTVRKAVPKTADTVGLGNMGRAAVGPLRDEIDNFRHARMVEAKTGAPFYYDTPANDGQKLLRYLDTESDLNKTRGVGNRNAVRNIHDEIESLSNKKRELLEAGDITGAGEIDKQILNWEGHLEGIKGESRILNNQAARARNAAKREDALMDHYARQIDADRGYIPVDAVGKAPRVVNRKPVLERKSTGRDYLTGMHSYDDGEDVILSSSGLKKSWKDAEPERLPVEPDEIIDIDDPDFNIDLWSMSSNDKLTDTYKPVWEFDQYKGKDIGVSDYDRERFFFNQGWLKPDQLSEYKPTPYDRLENPDLSLLPHMLDKKTITKEVKDWVSKLDDKIEKKIHDTLTTGAIGKPLNKLSKKHEKFFKDRAKRIADKVDYKWERMGGNTLGRHTWDGEIQLNKFKKDKFMKGTHDINQVLTHEKFHNLLYPSKKMPFHKQRVELAKKGYGNSPFLMGLEEILANLYATGNLPYAIKKSTNAAYSTVDSAKPVQIRQVLDGLLNYGAATGLGAYGANKLGNRIFQPSGQE